MSVKTPKLLKKLTKIRDKNTSTIMLVKKLRNRKTTSNFEIEEHYKKFSKEYNMHKKYKKPMNGDR